MLSSLGITIALGPSHDAWYGPLADILYGVYTYQYDQFGPVTVNLR